ncbi:Caspase-1 [Melipona quadrifasciata]|uniref:Caspase-1 n=1 Tax=Melipona quadrifasciata TaxID=166423 RepID=A0A0M8ZXB6_9HYME|nr:Caspase-1 [Melipona quadrifasciata]
MEYTVLQQRKKALRDAFFGISEEMSNEVDSWMSRKPNLPISLPIFNERFILSLNTTSTALEHSKQMISGGSKSGRVARSKGRANSRVFHDSMNILTAAEDHTDADCLIVAAMSHGESGFLHTTDNVYPVDMLWTPFLGDRCPSLASKPKLFFIQSNEEGFKDGIKIIYESRALDAASVRRRCAPSVEVLPISDVKQSRCGTPLGWVTVAGSYNKRSGWHNYTPHCTCTIHYVLPITLEFLFHRVTSLIPSTYVPSQMLTPFVRTLTNVIQSEACRGTQLDNGVEIIHETDSTSNYSLPAYADIMVAYSTYDGG